eukprot:CAMPEP_0198683238 /NCGR_PEP_ID=MMETSP1468-20131203/10245_1 /TAXON_ID=1461545 /ORGANISM="Mantoniella sp, Strain CCMP1436" /LENGTH=115 /DNA_ID=CAMNT_0044427039 /DNA_START=90 /DNA_END=437 /DNA_ORIENTATION=+
MALSLTLCSGARPAGGARERAQLEPGMAARVRAGVQDGGDGAGGAAAGVLPQPQRHLQVGCVSRLESRCGWRGVIESLSFAGVPSVPAVLGSVDLIPCMRSHASHPSDPIRRCVP